MERKYGLKEIRDFLCEICPMVSSVEPLEEHIRRIDIINEAIFALLDLEQVNTLIRDGYLLLFNCRVGDTVYEIFEETVPYHHFYIQEYEVQDVSVNAVKYADDWVDWIDWSDGNAYFTREAAEAVLKIMEGKKNEDKTALD